MDATLFLMGSTLLGAVVAWSLAVWISERITMRGSMLDRGRDPILGPKDRIAIHDARGPFIPMPEQLSTKDEMVAWMTKDLPRLVAEKQGPNAP